MSKAEALAFIDAELARLRNLNPLERERLNKLLANSSTVSLTDKVFGK